MKLTKKQLVEKLDELQNCGDIEIGHHNADNLLIQFIGDKKVKEAYDKVNKWYA